ncbi:flagellar biosynthesis anti-sigma factor FlgM [Salipaludibacillus aurantiacus]|uniref:Negative regulator of flagellin synthesis n=1 Tax=Salipaludibacillus aurantiacus TaxID=1601833 RepID=A0A1H9W8X3_9BACI|nr:flagellar biosynthesis anti-sigma factor FlgM [Salipaludibacillus aurantiacus]SES30274.1 negative regulator of flagellin synthesis FlgM [Salipaludibacillus aurantiacus]
MKINPMHSIQAYRKLQETQQKHNDKTTRSDQVEISSEAKEMAKSTDVSAQRQQRVDEVKAQIEKGTYEINHKAVAKKFYEFWNK